LPKWRNFTQSGHPDGKPLQSSVMFAGKAGA